MPDENLASPFKEEIKTRRQKIQELKAKLSEPFDPEDISWKPQTVDYGAKTATAAAYADPRVYVDRLNETVGPENWEDTYEFIVTPFNKYIKAKKGYGGAQPTEEKQIPGNKVLCVATVSIEGMGSFSSTGDSDAADENAATSAEAQAFKRACMKFGVGRYLYNLPSSVHPYDTKKGGWFGSKPVLPDWALPKVTCEDCNNTVTSYEHNGEAIPVARIVLASKKYGKKLCADCQRKRAGVSQQASGNRLDRAI